jgi:hypothetical protein
MPGIFVRVEVLLITLYGMHGSDIARRITCQSCGYPTPIEHAQAQTMCAEYRSAC